MLPHHHTCTLTLFHTRLARKHRSSHHRHYRAGRIPAQSSEDRQPQPSHAEFEDREWKADDYITQAPEASPLPITEVDAEQRLNEQVRSFAASAAASEEQAFTAALTDMQQQGTRASQPPLPWRPTAPPQPSKSGQDLREAAMRRITEARKYVGAKGANPPATQASPAQAKAPSQQGSAPGDTLSTSSVTEWGQSSMGTSEKVSLLPMCENHKAWCMHVAS